MLVQKVQEIIKQKFGTVEGIAGMVKTLVKGIVSVVASKAAPFVGASLDIVRVWARPSMRRSRVPRLEGWT